MVFQMASSLCIQSISFCWSGKGSAAFVKFLHQITFLVGEASLEEGEECFSPNFGTDLTFVKDEK